MAPLGGGGGGFGGFGPPPGQKNEYGENKVVCFKIINN